jgi:tRNA(Ile)-lysidine synthase
VARVDVPRGGGRSPEEAARLARHAALARVARTIGAGRIALGHTADDQVETVLMRVLQGAGPRGLAGIPVRRGPIVRPLLDVPRTAVLAHLADHGLAAVDDATNRDPTFFRNRLRHEVLPLLVARIGPRMPDALRRLARASGEAVAALDALVRPRLAGHLAVTPVGWRLALAAFDDLPPGAVKAAMRLTLVDLALGDRLAGGLRAAHLDALAGLLAARPGARVRLPGGIVVERGRDALWVVRADQPPLSASLAVPGRVPAGQMAAVTAALDPPASGRPADPTWETWFDAEVLGLRPGPPLAGGPLLVRPRRSGDRMVPFGSATPVRLTKLLAAAGVPRLARAGWPVVTRTGERGEDAEVLWLVGVRRGTAAPVTARTRTTLRLHALVPAPGWPVARSASPERPAPTVPRVSAATEADRS